MGELTTIVVTLATALGSAGAWQFWQNRMRLQHERQKDDKSEQTLFRDDLRERVAVLETRLEEAQQEKESTQRKLSEVLQQLAEYKVRLEFLEKENQILKAK